MTLFIDIPSYLLGLVTGVVGSLIVLMIAGRSISRRGSLLEQTISHVQQHYENAVAEGDKGNYGEAKEEIEQAKKEIEGMKNEIATEEILAPPENENKASGEK